MGNLLKEVLHTFLRPGIICEVPVTYVLGFPPSFFLFDENRKEFYTDEKNDYWFDKENLKYIKELGTQKLIYEAEVRPFLVIQSQKVIQLLKKIAIPKWYKNAITGFPISGLDNIENINNNLQKEYNTNLKTIDINRLISKNDYEFIHYLPKKRYPKLDKDSYIVLAAITTLNIEYFFGTNFGLEDKDYDLVKLKIKDYFRLDKND